MLCSSKPTGLPPPGFPYQDEMQVNVKEEAEKAFKRRQSLDANLQKQPVWYKNNAELANLANIKLPSFHNETTEVNNRVQPPGCFSPAAWATPDCFSPTRPSAEHMSYMSMSPYGASPMSMGTGVVPVCQVGRSAYGTPSAPVMIAHPSAARAASIPLQMTPVRPRAASENPGVGNYPGQLEPLNVPTQSNSHPIVPNRSAVNYGTIAKQQFLPGQPAMMNPSNLDSHRALSVPSGTPYNYVPLCANVGPAQYAVDQTGQMYYAQPAYVETIAHYPIGTHGMSHNNSTQGMRHVVTTQGMSHATAVPQNHTVVHGTPPLTHGPHVIYAQPVQNSVGPVCRSRTSVVLPPPSRAQVPNIGGGRVGGVRSYSAPPQEATIHVRSSTISWKQTIVRQKESCGFGRSKKPVERHINLPRSARSLNIRTKKSKKNQQRKRKSKGEPGPGKPPDGVKEAAARLSLSSNDPNEKITKEMDQEQRDSYACMPFREPEDDLIQSERQFNKVTLWVIWLGLFVTIGTFKLVVKPMGGMIRARDAKIAIPIDKNSSQYGMLQQHKMLLDAEGKTTVKSDALAEAKGYKKETGPRVPNLGYAKIEFVGEGCARRATRVFDVINACSIGDLAHIRATWESQEPEEEVPEAVEAAPML